jgi:hypothetical protein
MNREGTPISNDVSTKPQPDVEQTKLQNESRHTVVDASARSPQWQPMNANVPDKNAAKTGYRYEDVKGEGFRKEPKINT